MIVRRVLPTSPVGVEYSLTPSAIPCANRSAGCTTGRSTTRTRSARARTTTTYAYGAERTPSPATLPCRAQQGFVKGRPRLPRRPRVLRRSGDPRGIRHSSRSAGERRMSVKHIERRRTTEESGDGQWSTLSGRKKVLVLVHTEVYGKRLQDVLPLLESDLRVEVVFTIAPHAFNEGAARFLRDLGATVLPWQEAVRTEFDLALTMRLTGHGAGAGADRPDFPRGGPHVAGTGAGRRDRRDRLGRRDRGQWDSSRPCARARGHHRPWVSDMERCGGSASRRASAQRRSARPETLVPGGAAGRRGRRRSLLRQDRGEPAVTGAVPRGAGAAPRRASGTGDLDLGPHGRRSTGWTPCCPGC